MLRSPIIGILILAGGCASGLREVRDVTVTGNEAVSDDDLTDGIANHAPAGLIIETSANYQPLQLVLDEQRIETAYHMRGYYSARVVDTCVTDVDEDTVDIEFRVREGPPTLLERVEIMGAPDAPGVDARALGVIAALQIDVPIAYASYQHAADAIRSHLLNESYAYARVEPRLEVDRDRGRATAVFQIDAGPRAVFGAVRVEGLERTPPSVVLERISWKPGDRFDPVLLERTRIQVYSTGLLGSVRFTWDTDARSRELDIVVHAAEGTRHEVRVGGGVGVDRTRYEARARFDYTHRNFLDDRTTLRIAARPSLAFLPSGNFVGWNVDAEVSLERTDLFAPLWVGHATVDYALSELDAFAYQGPGLRLGYGRRWLDDRLVFGVSAVTRLADFIRIEPGVAALADAIGLHAPQGFVALEPNITYDGRDDPQGPHDGIYAKLGMELGRVIDSAPHSYAAATAELRGYTPLFTDRLIGAARLRVGSALADLGHLPVTQRFFSGGAEAQRGFGRGRLSPWAPGADGEQLPIGGEAMVESSVEVRLYLFDIFDNALRFVAFLDGADVALSFTELRVPELHYATGAGLRYDTPVGPVRFDFGVRLNRLGPTEPDTGNRYAFHLSLGEAF